MSLLLHANLPAQLRPRLLPLFKKTVLQEKYGNKTKGVFASKALKTKVPFFKKIKRTVQARLSKCSREMQWLNYALQCRP